MPYYGCIVVIKRNGADGSVFPMTESECIVGKHVDSDIRVQVEAAADKHARLHYDNNQVYLTSLSGSHVLTLNDVAIGCNEATLLKDGDVFSIGARAFRWSSLTPANNTTHKGTNETTKKHKRPESPETTSKSPKTASKSPKTTSKGPKVGLESPNAIQKRPKSANPETKSIDEDQNVHVEPTTSKKRQSLPSVQRSRSEKKKRARSFGASSNANPALQKGPRDSHATTETKSKVAIDDPKLSRKELVNIATSSPKSMLPTEVTSSLRTPRKRVSFGPYVSPEYIDKTMPPNSPIRRGAPIQKHNIGATSVNNTSMTTPKVRQRLASPAASLLKKTLKKMASVPPTLVEETEGSDEQTVTPLKKRKETTPTNNAVISASPTACSIDRSSASASISELDQLKILQTELILERKEELQRSKRKSSSKTTLRKVKKSSLAKTPAKSGRITKPASVRKSVKKLAVKKPLWSDIVKKTSNKKSAIESQSKQEPKEKVLKKKKITKKRVPSKYISKTPVKLRRSGTGHALSPEKLVIKSKTATVRPNKIRLQTRKRSSTTSNNAARVPNIVTARKESAKKNSKMVYSPTSVESEEASRMNEPPTSPIEKEPKVPGKELHTPSQPQISFDSRNDSNSSLLEFNPQTPHIPLEVFVSPVNSECRTPRAAALTAKILFQESFASTRTERKPTTPNMVQKDKSSSTRLLDSSSVLEKVAKKVTSESKVKRTKKGNSSVDSKKNGNQEGKKSISKNMERIAECSNKEPDNGDISFAHLFILEENSRSEEPKQTRIINNGHKRDKGVEADVSFAHIFEENSKKKSPKAFNFEVSAGHNDVSFAHIFDREDNETVSTPKREKQRKSEGTQDQESKDISFAHIFSNNSTEKSLRAKRSTRATDAEIFDKVDDPKKSRLTRQSASCVEGHGIDNNEVSFAHIFNESPIKMPKRAEREPSVNDVSFAHIFDIDSTPKRATPTKTEKKRSPGQGKNYAKLSEDCSDVANRDINLDVSFAHLFQRNSSGETEKSDGTQKKEEFEMSDVSFAHIFKLTQEQSDNNILSNSRSVIAQMSPRRTRRAAKRENDKQEAKEGDAEVAKVRRIHNRSTGTKIVDKLPTAIKTTEAKKGTKSITKETKVRTRPITTLKKAEVKKQAMTDTSKAENDPNPQATISDTTVGKRERITKRATEKKPKVEPTAEARTTRKTRAKPSAKETKSKTKTRRQLETKISNVRSEDEVNELASGSSIGTRRSTRKKDQNTVERTKTSKCKASSVASKKTIPTTDKDVGEKGKTKDTGIDSNGAVIKATRSKRGDTRDVTDATKEKERKSNGVKKTATRGSTKRTIAEHSNKEAPKTKTIEISPLKTRRGTAVTAGTKSIEPVTKTSGNDADKKKGAVEEMASVTTTRSGRVLRSRR